MDELPSDHSADDPLFALLDTFTVAGSDIEHRVMAQLEHEQEQVTLQAEVAELRADVAAIRADIAELKRILLSGRDAPLAHPANDSRGKSLLPYAKPDKSLPILN